jgi:L,D-transpeptidase ErfK/SrfK
MKSLFLLFIPLLAVPHLHALTFSLPHQGNMIGKIQITTVKQDQSLGEIGRIYDIGLYEMIEANPGLDPWVPPKGAEVIIPTEFILPPGPQQGMVLNLAEMRMYYYHPTESKVTTHPIAVGRRGWSTPLGQTTIVGKKKDPSWYPPISIRREHESKGDMSLPTIVPAGPDNPLGQYAFYSGFPAVLIHGTNRPAGVGARTTHGCIRLFPEDIESLFPKVPIGTVLRVIHVPFKAGWSADGHLYLEAHEPLSDPQHKASSSLSQLIHTIQEVIQTHHLVNWSTAKKAAQTPYGYPIRID